MSETLTPTTVPAAANILAGTRGYLTKALDLVRASGLLPEKPAEEAPAVALLKDVDTLDKTKLLVIAHTLQHMETFNRIVREHTAEVKLGDRFADIAQSFKNIREDCEVMITQLADGKIDWQENLQNVWRNVRRGTPHKQFEDISRKFKDVFADSKKQIDLEDVILGAFETFRLALSEGEIAAADLAKQQETNRTAAQNKFIAATNALKDYAGTDDTDRKRLQLARDEADQEFVREDRRYQLMLDLSENLKIGYNVGEVILMKFRQTHGVKVEVYRKATVFFTTCEHVLTSLDATITAQKGLHESTQTLEALKTGINESLETVARTGSAVETAALKSAYGPTVSADSVKKLVDEIVRFQTDSVQMIQGLRESSVKNAAEIQRITDDGKQRYADAVEKYKTTSKPVGVV